MRRSDLDAQLRLVLGAAGHAEWRHEPTQPGRERRSVSLGTLGSGWLRGRKPGWLCFGLRALLLRSALRGAVGDRGRFSLRRGVGGFRVGTPVSYTHLTLPTSDLV